MNRLLYALTFVLALLLYPQSALAHDVSAALTLDPPIPMKGQAGTVQLKLVDAYGSPMPAVAVRASFGAYGDPAPPWLHLKRTGAGAFSGIVSSPDSEAGIVRVEVDLPDDQWHAIVPVRLGVDWFSVKDLAIELSAGKLGTKQKAADPIPPRMTAEPKAKAPDTLPPPILSEPKDKAPDTLPPPMLAAPTAKAPGRLSPPILAAPQAGAGQRSAEPNAKFAGWRAPILVTLALGAVVLLAFRLHSHHN